MPPPERETARLAPSGFSNLWNIEVPQSYSPDLPSARHLASLLGGDVTRDRVLCPGPGHSTHDRSLSVTLDSAAPDGFMVHSFCGDDWRACRDYVRARLGLPHGTGDRVAVKIFRSPANDDDAARRTATALDLWHRAQPIAGTLAETYLGSRGLTYSGEALRWHPSCPFGKDALGCMVALVRNLVTDEPQAIHRTAIDADGRKIDRMALGPIRGGAIKLTDDEEVTLSIAVAEGIETALSIRNLPDLSAMPVWACISAGGIRSFPVLAGIESLWVAVDHDNAGILAARECAERWHLADREVTLLAPKNPGSDINDIGGRNVSG